MHVRVRSFGKPDTIVVVDSKLTKINEFRRLVKEKFNVAPKLQKLFYGGKLLENGYTFYDYGIKLNDVIQLIVKVEPKEEDNDKQQDEKNSGDKEIVYKDAVSKLYRIGDLVDVKMKEEQGSWLEGKIVQIVFDPEYEDSNKTFVTESHSTKHKNNEKGIDKSSKKHSSPEKASNDTSFSEETSKPDSNGKIPIPSTPTSPKLESENLSNSNNSSLNKSINSSPTTPTRKKNITDYFNKTPKSDNKSQQNSFKKIDNDENNQNSQKHVTGFNKTSKPVNGQTMVNIVNSNNVVEEDTDEGLLYKVEINYHDEHIKTDELFKVNEIRPRAFKELDIEALKPGDTVLINHNTSEPLEKGFWFDFKVYEVRKLRKGHELFGMLYLGTEPLTQLETRARVHDKIYGIEAAVPLRSRTARDDEVMTTETTLRTRPLNCTKCRDDEEMRCKECGCFECAGKDQPDKIVLCDECDRGYHTWCVSPPLQALPAAADDWYCPQCKRDDVDTSAPRRRVDTKAGRDWGRGMACVGKTQTCAMPANHFGPIPGVEVGMCWRFRIQLSESGVHRPPVSGIHGRDTDGAYSIVLSGGYEDDYDDGYEFSYTGAGGRDLSGNKRTAEQSCDQTLTRENKALARNCAAGAPSEAGGDAGADWRKGRPVRVVRSYKMLKHAPQYAPSEGIRYDGIYKVVKYYPETGKSGFRVWKYLLRRDDESPAPWEPVAKQFPVVYPPGYLEAEAEKKAKKEMEKSKKEKKGKKRVLKVRNGQSDDEELNADSPRGKKRKTRSSLGDSTEGTPKRGKQSKSKDKVSVSPNKNPFILAAKNKSPRERQSPGERGTSLLNDEEAAAVAADALNSKLWEECIAACAGQTKQELIKQVTEVFLCIICQEVAAKPVTTRCRHNFCMACLKLAYKSTGAQSCPCCRQDLSKDELEYNEQLMAALRTLMPGYDNGKK